VTNFTPRPLYPWKRIPRPNGEEAREPQSQFRRFENEKKSFIHMPGFELRTIQHVAQSRYRLCHPSTNCIRHTFWYRGILLKINTSAAPCPKYPKFQTPLVQSAATFIEMKYVNHFFLFQPNAPNMLNKYIYHQLPPTCFDVCYCIFRETIALRAQKLYALCIVIT
jgi:hypothetical protein